MDGVRLERIRNEEHGVEMVPRGTVGDHKPAKNSNLQMLSTELTWSALQENGKVPRGTINDRREGFSGACRNRAADHRRQKSVQ